MSKQPISIAPGVFDIQPHSQDHWKQSYLWSYIEDLIRQTANEYGYQEIRTPLFERTELFQRGVGETSDIVSKEMYTFMDKGERSMSLRPEGTAPVMRSFIENQLQNLSSVHKLFYIAPMFRYERSQAGRYRQHHQFGVEAIGNSAPEQDVEVIDMLYTFYQRMGLKNLELRLNSIGETSCRLAYRSALQDYLRNFFHELSEDSQVRFEINPLRILDSKNPNDQKLLKNAPSILDFLSEDSKEHFRTVQTLLDQLKIPYHITPQLVRGLDYYNRTVFEVVAGELGAQNSIGGGGRYDGLMKMLGGPNTPAMGFGTGLERVIQTALKQGVVLPEPPKPMIFMIALGEEAKRACFSLLHDLRSQGISSEMDFSGRKLNKLMQQADQMRAVYTIVIGESELRTQTVDLKEMATGEKISISLTDLPRILQIELKTKNFLELWSEMSTPFKTETESKFFIQRAFRSISQTREIAQTLRHAAEQMKSLLADNNL